MFQSIHTPRFKGASRVEMHNGGGTAPTSTSGYRHGNFWWLALCWFGLLLACAASAAQPAPHSPAAHRIIVLPDAQTAVDLTNYFWLAADPSGTRTLAQMRQADFAPATSKVKLPGNGGATWLQFTVAAHSTDTWYLDIGPPWTDSVTLYRPDAQDNYRALPTGDRLPFSSREVAGASYAFRLAPSTAPATYYLRMQSTGSVWVRAVLRPEALFIDHTTQLAHTHGAEMGALLVLMLLAALHGLAFRDGLHAVFVAYVAVTILLLGTGTGFLARYVLFDMPGLADLLPPFLGCLNVTIYAVFCRRFLTNDAYGRHMAWVFHSLIWLGIVGAALVTIPALRFVLPLFIALSMLGAIVPVVALCRPLLRGRWSSRALWFGLLAKLPAQGIFLSGLVTNQQVGNWLPLHWFVAAMMLHLLLLSFTTVERARRANEERRHLHDALAAQVAISRNTERLAQEQRSFLSMVAHELRSPLAAARSAAYNLAQMLSAPAVPGTPIAPSPVGQQDPDHAKLDRTDRIETSLVQMAALIDVCLLHEQRSAAQALSLHQHLTLRQVIDQARNEYYANGPATPRLVWPDAPAASSVQAGNPANTAADTPFEGNAALLAIALRNLIENACRYDTTGSPVEVSVRSNPASQHTGAATVSLQVLDRGPGLKPNQEAHLFEPFTRGQLQTDAPGAPGTTDVSASGLGLGLYIVRRIAGMHGATAAWQPRDGGGSVFSITLAAGG